MSTTQPIDPLDPRLRNYFPTPPISPTADATGKRAASSAALPPDTGPTPGGDDIPPDPSLVQETKNQIRQIVNEITQLAQSDVSLDEFYAGFLQRVISALAAFGGAIWTLEEDGSLLLQYQINLAKTRVGETSENEKRHKLLLRQLAATGQPVLTPPQSGGDVSNDAGNPTDFLLVVSPFHADQRVRGVVEVFQRHGGGPATQRGYLRFLSQMCELASDFLKNRKLRQYQDRQQLWEQLEQFLRAIHRSLDTKETAFTIANEGRRLIHCDRVSVGLMRGKRCDIEVVSGLDTIDRRADEVRRMSDLVTLVVSAGQPMWYSHDTRDLAPQVEQRLQSYLDRSHAKLVAVLPLFQPLTDEEKKENVRPTVLGAIVVEQLGDDHITDSLRQRSETVAAHGAAALANAVAHQSLFLLPLWQTLGKARWVTQARNLPKTVLGAVGVIAATAALWLVPANFTATARGKLQPAERRELFALTSGTVIEVPVEHGDVVEPGQILIRMRSDELQNEILTLRERESTTKEKISSLQRALINSHGAKANSSADQNQLAGELAEMKATANNIQSQLKLHQQKAEQLVLLADSRIQVMTWHARDLLLQRPVQTGQALLSLANPDGAWELELYVPERRIGHVLHAWDVAKAEQQEEADAQLSVTFSLSTHPGQEFIGRVIEIHRTAEVRGEEGNTVLVRVAINKEDIPELHSETTVTGQIHCGRRSLGFVLFQDVIEMAKTKMAQWF